MIVKYQELHPNIKKWIPKSLRRYFDEITYFNKDKWLMKYKYGNSELFQSFEITNIMDELTDFEQQKVFLFTTGVCLYYIHDNERIELVHDITALLIKLGGYYEL